MIKLSKRLETILHMTPISVVADIGSDHGKLMIALFEKGTVTHGYAIENKKGPYNRLVKALTDANLINDIIPLMSDGLTDLPDIVSTIILAGMGGKTIVDIIKAHPQKLKNVETIIIDAHSDVPFVRKEISNLGYIIVEETIIKEEGIYYEIIRFKKGEYAFYGEHDLTFGPYLRKEKSAIFKEKYQQRIYDIDNILTLPTIPKARKDLLNEEKRLLQKEIAYENNNVIKTNSKILPQKIS